MRKKKKKKRSEREDAEGCCSLVGREGKGWLEERDGKRNNIVAGWFLSVRYVVGIGSLELRAIILFKITFNLVQLLGG